MSAKLRFLVTAGNTHERIDRVREWTNIFTGRTGLDVALALLDLGDVTLLTSNRQHAAEFNGYSGKQGMLGIETYSSHTDLIELLADQFSLGGIDAVAMSAAVSDYVPAGVFRIVSREEVSGPGGQERWIVESIQAAKVKSHYDQIAIAGARTPKIVDMFRSTWAFTGLLIKFKLEVGITEDQLLTVADASRRSSQAQFIVANTLDMVQGPAPAAWILGDALRERIGRPTLAPRLRDLVAQHLATHKAP